MQDDELVLRRQQLLTRSAELRLALAVQTRVLRKPLGLVDRAREALQWLADHPAWPAGAALVLVLLRPRNALKWGGRVWWAWQSYKQARAWVAKQD